MYGIDVILIEPGPIKTLIWENSLNLPAEVMNTDYGSSLSKFVQHLSWSAKKGVEVDDLAEKVYEMYLKRNPKTRYVVTHKKLLSYTIPRYLISQRRFDSFLKKMFF